MNKSFRSRVLGVSLLEVVVSMGILGAVLGVVSQYFISSSQVTTNVANETAMQGELRTVGAMITDEIQRAMYIFPPCGEFGVVNNASTGAFDPYTVYDAGCNPVDPSTDNLARVKNTYRIKIATSGNTLVNLGAASTADKYIWYVGVAPPGTPTSDPRTLIKSYPLLAMIVGPRDPQVQCRMTDSLGKPIDAESAVQPDGCYQFVAYYPVKRKCLSTAAPLDNACNATGPAPTGLRGQLDPGDSGEAWVLMEYRRNLSRDIAPTGYSINYSTSNATRATWVVTETGRTGDVYRINWGSAGCGQPNNAFSGICPTGMRNPSPDPSRDNQLSINSLPAIARATGDPNVIYNFRMRIQATKEWIEHLGETPASDETGTGKILVEHIRPNHGFQIDFPSGSIDERGVTEVRLRLQAELRGKTVPNQPLEFFASPRNMSAN